MGNKKQSKKLKVNKETVRKGALDDKDADKAAGGAAPPAGSHVPVASGGTCLTPAI